MSIKKENHILCVVISNVYNLCVFMNQDMSHLTDQEIVTRTLQENPELFGQLIDRYEQKLLRYIRRITQVSKHDAEDILQDVFIKVYENLRGFDTSLSFSSWIYRICHNHVVSLHRKKQTKVQKGLVEIEDTILQNIASEIDIFKELHSDELKYQIQENLERVSKTHKEILVLRFFEEKSYEEISDILQKPMGTIATLISRAKKEFTKYWNTSYDIN